MIINREKFEIIRKIIHDTLLGNIVLVVIALMSPVLLDKIAEPFNIIIASAMSISFIFILCWLASSIWLYTGELAKNKSLRCTLFILWALSAEGSIILTAREIILW
ncbi:hypothetical protein NUI69_004219 [Escherichia coli]|nr:hypothetical protein [Escherichia coli]